ncbi:acyltransferase [Cohnella lubricantis]|uniref:Acyltransferase n=1 Tax=Cohnella lubricantis TaxID=2163172 RepID=A0A841TFP9_9BACL|nr:acyltransferase [Cohnella lubricantis]MBB6678779.1 acyltransferase [Cohnella lubricantis]MBP2117863.1 peptidoglycan/LPS O-acetylase OafA/YrhL [Cohnella lubricantis]
MIKLSVFERNNNNFDLVRLIAALSVIWAHSYAIAPKAGKADFLARLTQVTHSGEVAVFIFFFLSGALIFKSAKDSSSTFSFAVKRFFRIYPALVACVLFIVVIGSLLTNLDISEYFTNDQVHRYIKNNLSLIWNEHFLPGVFTDHPDQGLNGSLWSITLEARLYLMVAVLSLFGVLRERETANIALFLLIAAVGISPQLVPLIGSDMGLLGLNVFPQYTITFLLGGLVFYNNNHFRINGSLVIIFTILLICCEGFIHNKYYIMLFFISLAYYIGTSSLTVKLHLPIDISYGVYLYGWPSSQLVYEMLPQLQPEVNALLSCILASLLATASWYFVEKPSIKLARRITQWMQTNHGKKQITM